MFCANLHKDTALSFREVLVGTCYLLSCPPRAAVGLVAPVSGRTVRTCFPMRYSILVVLTTVVNVTVF